MKAIVCTRYGSPDVLELQEVEKPIPKEDEVLVKVHASSATTADTMMRRGTPFYARLFLGFTKPKPAITGTGFAGEVEAVGRNVTRYQEGDKVFGETGVGFSANADYVCIPETGVMTTLPNNMTYEAAAPICDGALTSFSFLKDIATLQEGDEILINGASGSLGTAAVQISKYLGAQVTGVCGSANQEMVQELGAQKTIDYTKADYTRMDHHYDIIFDTIGKSSFGDSKHSLTQTGLYLSPVLNMALLLQMLWTSQSRGKKAKFSATGLRPEDELRALLEDLKEVFESGKMTTVIDQYFPLEDTAEAHRYIETGHKRGNVV
ncbi:MAG: NAD(P)-dependent alcohol dehydrogenase, partial [Methanobacteriota archaeon]